MDITSSLCTLDKQLQSMGLKDKVKSNILSLVMNMTKYASEKPEISNTAQLIDLYSKEIVEVVTSNKHDKNVCEEYVKFAISKIIESVKEKK